MVRSEAQQAADVKPIRMAIFGSVVLHLLLLALLRLLGTWQPPPESQPPAVLQVSVTSTAARVVSSPAVAKPQSKMPVSASRHATAATTAPWPAKPVNHVLAAVNGLGETAAVSPAPAETTTLPATPSETAPAASLGNIADAAETEVVEVAAPAQVDPGYRSLFKPVYPLSARRRGIEGTVVLRVEVLPNGEPGRVEVTQSSGNDSLDESARKAVEKLRFSPAQKGGKAIVGWANVPYQFKLES